MDYKAKYRSFGFRGKLWDKGEIVKNITEEELKKSEIKHFELFSSTPTKAPVKAEGPQYLSLLTYRKLYVEKFCKDIPKDRYNDPEWLKNEIEKPNEKIAKVIAPQKAANSEEELVALRGEFQAKFGKEVPVNKKNKIDWIKLKLKENE